MATKEQGKKFTDYIQESYDYPDYERLLRGLAHGVAFNYVSSTYLNGFVNYVTPVKVFVAGRYRAADDVRTLPGRLSEFFGKSVQTKEEVFKVLTTRKTVVHTDLSVFADDVLLLGRTLNLYVVFWFDMDVSDCSIWMLDLEELGISEAALIDLFVEFVTTDAEANRLHPAWEWDPKYISGWLHF